MDSTAGLEQLADAPLTVVLDQLGLDPSRGLGEGEAEARLQQYGPNALEEEEQSPLLALLAHFWGPIPWMLEGACVLSAIAGRWEDFAVIFAMLLINGGVSYWHEHRAHEEVKALQARLALKARVVRDGEQHEIAAADLVPGDLVVLRRGDLVPADAMLLAEPLSVDESSLTGESLPVDRDRGEVVYASTAVKRGEARAVVVGTGEHTRFGHTVELVKEPEEASHFQRAVLRIGYFLMACTGALVLAVVVTSLLRGERPADVLIFALVLTIAGIPSALPAVLTVTMSAGARALARSDAIVTRLSAMEEIAGISILFSDKTGTLTRNQLQLQEPVLIEGRDAGELAVMAALTAERSEDRDPIDDAILAAVDEHALASFEVVSFAPFDSTRKRAEAEVRRGDERFRVTKGAPQVVLELVAADDALEQRVSAAVDDLAERGFRALGVARCDDGQWRYLGLLALLDPPRDDAAEVVASALAHGIDLRMVTGDHVAIARQVARQVGLGDEIVAIEGWKADEAIGEELLRADGFAEVTPEDKYHLVGAFQRRGVIVGMTGDGVNDAPALKKANAGFAVAEATDAARAASDVVMTRPGLGVIVGAVEESRRIFERMQAYATYRIAETTRMVLFVSASILMFGSYPVTAIMVVLLAILNDIPIMAISMDNTRTPERPVRWNMPWVMTQAAVLGILGVGTSFLLFWYARTHLGVSGPELQTLMFLKLLVAGHLTIYVTRREGWMWERPWPSWQLFVALEATQVVGTVFALAGWIVSPLRWPLVLGVWLYALAAFLLLDAVKVVLSRTLRPAMQHPQP